MRNGYILKSASSPQDIDLEKINLYTRRKFSAEELYTFRVVLCDNDIDRDFEQFSTDSLGTLAQLFCGKTGIFNHSFDAKGQSARIYDAAVEAVPGRTTRSGEPYKRLVAKAYMLRTKGNEDLILEIDGGIKKEVSVGCAMGKAVCSVCGADLRQAPCGHRPGEEYGGKLCWRVLSDPQDAYEWSFVTVPAQREAGVTKGLCGPGGRKDTDDAVLGRLCREALLKRAQTALHVLTPGLSPDAAAHMAAGLSPSELLSAGEALLQAASKKVPLTPQLAPEKSQKPAQSLDAFLI